MPRRRKMVSRLFWATLLCTNVVTKTDRRHIACARLNELYTQLRPARRDVRLTTSQSIRSPRALPLKRPGAGSVTELKVGEACLTRMVGSAMSRAGRVTRLYILISRRSVLIVKTSPSELYL